MLPVTETLLSQSAPDMGLAHPATTALGGQFHKLEGKDREFNHRLEAVRGVAAMMVAAGHSMVILPSFGLQRSAVGVLQLIFNGRAAVTVFFVLSGVVLGMSLRRSKQTFLIETCAFYIRRFLRIYPAFLLCTVTILIYVVSGLVGQPPPAAGPWFERFYGIYHDPLTPKRTLLNLLFSGNSYNRVIWTLKVEMLCSFYLPLVHRIFAAASNPQRLLAFCALVGFWFIPKSGASGYMFMFIAGYLLPLIGPRVLSRAKKSRALSVCLLLGALPLLLCARLIYNGDIVERFGVMLEALGATTLIGLLLYGKELGVYRLLDHPIARFYGKISYSFYLWHMFCLLLVSKPLLAWIPKDSLWNRSLAWGFVLWAVSTLVATAVSYVSYRWLEKPLIELSKQISRWIIAQSEGSPSGAPLAAGGKLDAQGQ